MVKVSAKIPSYKIPPTNELVLLFSKEIIKVVDLFDVYRYVLKNNLENGQYTIKTTNTNTTFELVDTTISIINSFYSKAEIKDEDIFKPTFHFLIQLLERAFDLNLLVQMYQYLKENDTKGKVELTTTKGTIVFEKNSNIVSLLTGWKGIRKSFNPSEGF
ncbi:hypothetical protein ACNSOL_12395 (plasmid) [Aliarcobacter lanthieri]|uniref:hypothetical protein n=1 Tax=Aliarcobacter lanthieri TaxID=1355374 RepID=UPI003AAFB489